MKKRDDFPKPVIRTLRDRVAHRCSNPDCRVPTSAPKESDGVNNTGIAAHISAASPGGARYDPSMSKEDRISIDNAIWLCSICATKIDKDEKRYPVETLKRWRNQAEEAALKELGNKLPSNSDTIDTVALALTGHPKGFIASAISNVHSASSNALEMLDPRFSVKSSYVNGVSKFDIHAKENVPLSMKVVDSAHDEFIKKYKRLFEHGDDIELDSSNIEFEGSKLFESLTSERNGIIKISSNKKQGSLKLWLVQKESGMIHSFDDVIGDISFGTKTFSFKGSACSNLFKFSFSSKFNNVKNKANITIILDENHWDNISVCELPYFEKMLSLFSRISDGWEIFTSLEANGDNLCNGTGLILSEVDYFKNIAILLSYIKKCRILSKGLGCNIRYTKGAFFSSDEHQRLSDIVDILQGNLVYSEDDCGEITSSVIADESCENIRNIFEMSTPVAIRFTQSEGEEIIIFGTKITLPPLSICLESVIPKITSDISNVRAGDLVEMEWVKQEGFSGLMRYEL